MFANPTDTTNALRALERLDAQWAFYDDYDRRRMLREAIAALATAQPEDAPAVDGGDAVRELCAVVADYLEQWGTPNKLPVFAALAEVENAIAATPAPAVEREAVGYVEGAPPARSLKARLTNPLPGGTKLYTTPPAEAREPVGDAEAFYRGIDPQAAEDAARSAGIIDNDGKLLPPFAPEPQP